MANSSSSAIIVIGSPQSDAQIYSRVVQALGVARPDALGWLNATHDILTIAAGTLFSPPRMDAIEQLIEHPWPVVDQLIRQAPATPWHLYSGAGLCITIPIIHPRLPNPRYIFVRRDIRDAGISDLEYDYISRCVAFLMTCRSPITVVSAWQLRDSRYCYENVRGIADFVGVKDRDVMDRVVEELQKQNQVIRDVEEVE